MAAPRASSPSDLTSDTSSLSSAPARSPTPRYASPSISSDTSGSVSPEPRLPGSTFNPRALPDEQEPAEQVTECQWEGCGEGDLGDMDALVQHIHEDHIGARKSRYTCEWEGCLRKGMNHASGYALRAHMRSHTREKPFYCTLPECDRSFTRSDALAKHMRTVHETEALRPSDPVPKSHSSGNPPPVKPAKRSKKKAQEEGNDGENSGDEVYQRSGGCYTSQDGFSDDEIVFPPRELYAYLSRKLEFLESENRELERRRDYWKERYKRSYAIKEKVLDEKAFADVDPRWKFWQETSQERDAEGDTVME